MLAKGHILLYYIVLYYISFSYIILYYIVLCCIMLYCIISSYLILYEARRETSWSWPPREAQARPMLGSRSDLADWQPENAEQGMR